MVVREVNRTQVLEIAKILFDDLHDVLGIELGLDGFMRKFYSA